MPEQLGRRAVLDDDAVAEHARAVATLHSREALRRDEHGPSRDGGTERVDEQTLGLRVDRRERVVEDDDARAGDERACEGDALPLSTGEVHAALADQRVVAVRELAGELRDT